MYDLFTPNPNYLLLTNAKQGHRRKLIMSGATCLCVFIPGGSSFAHIHSVKSHQTPWSYFRTNHKLCSAFKSQGYDQTILFHSFIHLLKFPNHYTYQVLRNDCLLSLLKDLLWTLGPENFHGIFAGAHLVFGHNCKVVFLSVKVAVAEGRNIVEIEAKTRPAGLNKFPDPKKISSSHKINGRYLSHWKALEAHHSLFWFFRTPSVENFQDVFSPEEGDK